MLPLGKIKLRAVELLQAIVSLKKAPVIDEVRDQEVMQVVLKLIKKHPWNNMVQLKAHQIFEDVFQSDLKKEQKLEFLKKSEVTQSLINMAEDPQVTFSSGNNIRNGFMGFVIKLANLLVKQGADLK